MIEEIEIALNTLKNIKPIILNLTNYVTMDFIANSLLSLGAAPIMSVCDEEIEELVRISHTIHINIGTLDKSFIKRCHIAARVGYEYQKPLILDPVGAGASLIRTNTCHQLLPFTSIIRGNASEIISLTQKNGSTLGVESANTTDEAKEAALKLSKHYGCIVIVSGPIDFITDGSKEMEIPYGSDLMQRVTGMGCTLTSVIAAFRAVISDNFEASVLATGYFGLCGMLATKNTQHPSSFRSHFIDTLHQTDFMKLRKIYVK